MSARLIKVLLFAFAFTAVAVAGFGVGEWEDTGNAQDAERETDIGEPETEDFDEPGEQDARAVLVEDSAKIDEPEAESLADTFAVVPAHIATQPRPRNPKRILDSVDALALAAKLETDRLLLSEIRKDVPRVREEAEQYLARLKRLAQESDPVQLAPLFNRVLDHAPIYFRWMETEYESQDERIMGYYVGGARGFAFAMDNFKSAVFFVIMNRLDIASRVISVLEEE